jgi:hypothetical protein
LFSSHGSLIHCPALISYWRDYPLPIAASPALEPLSAPTIFDNLDVIAV